MMSPWGILLLLVALVAHSAAFVVPAHALTQARPQRGAAVVMGRGDKRSKSGKRFSHSYGVYRPRNAKIRRNKRENPPTEEEKAATAARILERSLESQALMEKIGATQYATLCAKVESNLEANPDEADLDEANPDEADPD